MCIWYKQAFSWLDSYILAKLIPGNRTCDIKKFTKGIIINLAIKVHVKASLRENLLLWFLTMKDAHQPALPRGLDGQESS